MTEEATEEMTEEATEEMTEEATEDTGGAAAGGTAGQGGDLVLLQWQAPSQANALLSSGTKDLLAGSLVTEPLAEFAPDGSVIPALATEVPTPGNGISDDLTQITWTLRDDVVWSDGTPFTSADVVFSYEYCINEETGCSNEDFGDVTSVVADDDYTVTITFDAPKPYPFMPFVGYTSPVIQAAQFADCVGAAAKSCSDENFAPIGTGPYMITELRPEDTVTARGQPELPWRRRGQAVLRHGHDQGRRRRRSCRSFRARGRRRRLRLEPAGGPGDPRRHGGRRQSAVSSQASPPTSSTST